MLVDDRLIRVMQRGDVFLVDDQDECTRGSLSSDFRFLNFV